MINNNNYGTHHQNNYNDPNACAQAGIIIIIIFIIFIIFIPIFYLFKPCGRRLVRLIAAISLLLIYGALITICSILEGSIYTILIIFLSGLGAFSTLFGMVSPFFCEDLSSEYEEKKLRRNIYNIKNEKKEKPFLEDDYPDSRGIVRESISQSVVNNYDEEKKENNNSGVDYDEPAPVYHYPEQNLNGDNEHINVP